MFFSAEGFTSADLDVAIESIMNGQKLNNNDTYLKPKNKDVNVYAEIDSEVAHKNTLPRSLRSYDQDAKDEKPSKCPVCLFVAVIVLTVIISAGVSLAVVFLVKPAYINPPASGPVVQGPNTNVGKAL